jgi:glycosyltransferase involved in cell wall biosynthesis
MKNYYLDRKLKNKNLHVISNGRNISSNDLKKDFCDEYKMILDLKLNHKIIGCCGVLNKRKGFQDLIKFLTFNPDLLAVFVGEGPDKKRLIKYANKLNVLNRCYFLGHQNNAISFINLFDFFVMSSYSEGFPLVVLEAGGVGVPILCVKTPLFQELFSDNDVVFYERNIDKSMLDSLNNILLHKNTYSLNIQNTIQNKYSSDLMAKKYFQLYERLNNN